MRLALDHHYPKAIAPGLRDRGHDVVGAMERGWEQLEDSDLLTSVTTERRALVTNNVYHFAVLAQDWTAEGRSHFGLIFTSDRSLPKNRDSIGLYVDALDAILMAHPDDEALLNVTVWL